VTETAERPEQTPTARRAEIAELERTIAEVDSEGADTPRGRDREHLRELRGRLRDLKRREQDEGEDAPDSDEETKPDEDEGETPSGEAELPPQDPRSRTCDVCDGWGEVLTGSGVRVDSRDETTRKCWRCQGSGYLVMRLAPEEEARAVDERWQAPNPGDVWGASG
jgi:hypothetical protein